MIFNESEFDPAYRQFIQMLVQQCEVFTLLDNEDYYAECPSEVYDDNLGEPVVVYCFWDNAQAAQNCRQEEWANHRITVLDLEEFMSDVLLAMDEDECLVGVAFDAQLFGTEIEPIDLLSDLLNEIEAQNCQDKFHSFPQLLAYCQQWQAEAKQQQVIH